MNRPTKTARPKAVCRRSESGNIFFFIFIGVILFAALSFAVSNMMKTGNPERVSEEKARLYAGEVIDLGRKLKTAVQDLRISHACRTEEISFEVVGLPGYNFTTRDTCKVYNPAGGAMSYFPPENDWLDGATAGSSSLYKSIYFPASLCVQGVGEGVAGCESDGDDNEDLVLVVPFLQREVCEQINKSLGLPETPVALSGNLWAATPVKFQGTFADGQILDQNGLQAGCIAGSGTNNPPANSYHFVQVLVAR